jgi:hypothetical protein
MDGFMRLLKYHTFDRDNAEQLHKFFGSFPKRIGNSLKFFSKAHFLALK